MQNQAPVPGTTSTGQNPRNRMPFEVLLSAVVSFAVVALAPMILNAVGDGTVRVAIKPLFYVVLVGAPLLLSKMMGMPTVDLGLRGTGKARQLGIGMLLFAATAAAFTALALALGPNKGLILDTSGNITWYKVVHTMVFVGLGEEMLFRGYFLGRFMMLFRSGKWAVAMSALLFGIWHYPVGQDVLQVVITAVLGLVYGLAVTRIKECTTLSVGLAHGLHDVLLSVLGTVLA